MKKNIAKILIVAGVLLAVFALGRGLYYSPNGDSGLSLVTESFKATEGTTSEPMIGTTTKPISPSRLLIPELDIDAHVQHVGVTKNGNMAAPNNFTDVAWYKPGTLPGAKGSAVISGHQDNAMGLDGVFKHLDDLDIGDDIYVVGADGKRLHFTVVDEEIYAYNDPKPLPRIFNAADDNYLVLITCAGKWLQSAKTNDKRLVIYAKLVRE